MGERVMCPILRSECRGEGCVLWQFIPEGEACPFALEENSLEAIKEALSSSAKYLDEILGIDKESGRDLMEQLQESISDGKIDFRKLLLDVLNLD